MGEIRKAQKVKINFNTVEDLEKEFDCFIKEVHADRLTLDFPSALLDYIEYLNEGEEIAVKIFTPTGIKTYEAIVLNSPLEHDFVIEYIEQPENIQRREYLRVFMNLKVVIEGKGYNNNIVTHTLDVSGGGLRFHHKGEFEPNEPVKITLLMPNDRAVQAMGTVVQNNNLPKDEHVLFFTEISERERDRIIKKCFETQVTPES